MKLRNELQVGVDVDRTWAMLLDVPRVARALPGASIDPAGSGGVWRGTMKVERTEYAGTARLLDVDEDERVAGYRVEGREARGQGSAAATITARLAATDGGTRVLVETDLRVTGRQSQPGAGLMEEVAGAILGDFAGRLERELRGEAAGVAAVPEPLTGRAVLVLAGFVFGLAVGRAVRRR